MASSQPRARIVAVSVIAPQIESAAIRAAWTWGAGTSVPLKDSARVAELAAEVALSERSLHRRIAAATGQSPLDYLAGLRMALAQDLLADTRQSVDAVAGAVGYANTDAFHRAFLRHSGQAPSAYRRRLRR